MFTVNQVAPVCRGVGRFSVAGHAGLNRVRFSGRVQGKPLEAGTYRLSARTHAGRLVRRVTLVVVDGPAPTRAELAAARSANVCGASSDTTSPTLGSTTAPGLTAFAKAEGVQQEASASGTSEGSNAHSGAVLGATVEKAARAVQPLLLALLGLSILLLGVASLPRAAVPEPRVNELLAQHRLEIASLGAAALVAVAVAFLLG